MLLSVDMGLLGLRAHRPEIIMQNEHGRPDTSFLKSLFMSCLHRFLTSDLAKTEALPSSRTIFTWLLQVSACAQAHDIPWWGYRLVKVAVRKEGSVRRAPNAGPAWWDVVLGCRSPAVNHGARDRAVQIPGAGGRGLLLATVEQLVQRWVLESRTVVSPATGMFSRLLVDLVLFLLLFFIIFLSIHVHAVAYRAVGVCRGERGRGAGAGWDRNISEISTIFSQKQWNKKFCKKGCAYLLGSAPFCRPGSPCDNEGWL